MRQEEYIAACNRVVMEGCVLLENDGTLPFQKEESVAIFGREQFEYVKSGSGSGGLVNCPYVTNIHDSLCGNIHIDGEVETYYKKFIEENPYEAGDGWLVPAVQKQPMLEERFVKAAALRNDKALIVLARVCGESIDVQNKKGGYLLTDAEEQTLTLVTKHFKRVVVVVNSGNLIDLSWIKTYNVGAVMLVWQGGQEGGAATAALLLGEKSPSGKLPMTVASFDAYKEMPFGELARSIHTEDIYVGYRYMLTFCPEKVLYPFGYGRSYTKFQMHVQSCMCTKTEVIIMVDVTNVGRVSGKEVVQVYYSAPQGKLGKPMRELISFQKTKELQPNESQVLTLTFLLDEMRAFDDKNACGYGRAFVMEKGEYAIYVGCDSVQCDQVGVYVLNENKCIKKTSDAMHPCRGFMRCTPFGKELVQGYECVYAETELDELDYKGNQGLLLSDVKDGKCTMDEFLSQFTAEELTWLLKGEGWGSVKGAVEGSAAVIGGTTEVMRNHGVPIVTFCDGPSGLRTTDGKTHICIPSGTIIACTWDVKCIEDVFVGFSEELTACGIDGILAPGVNIQRHPFCGRNFEYFSEDPYLAGCFAAAIMRYFSEHEILAVIKHFAVNSQENGRDGVDEVLSERALREVYLKPFEIAVKAGNVHCIMTSYNRINGTSACSNIGLTDVILRKEWSYDGLVVSDWWARADRLSDGTWSCKNIAAMIKAQNDVQMVCSDAVTNEDDLLGSLEVGELSVSEVQRSAKRVLECVMKV